MSKSLLLIVGGGIAAYKMPEFIRRARDAGVAVRCVLTDAGKQFVTPLALASVSGDKIYDDLFSLTDEHEMGHIRLARDHDLIVVAPATADLIAKAACGLANDLASTVLCATDRPVLLAPAMNPVMWANKPLQRNLTQLRDDGYLVVGPGDGDTACGEVGVGRMAEPMEILDAALGLLGASGQPDDDQTSQLLAGLTALVTSGPTHEPIDPVRYIANRSSGKQGHAIAGALAAAGVDVTLVTGPVGLPDPPVATVHHVETAQEMMAACMTKPSFDIAIFAAAVADWRPDHAGSIKMKKDQGQAPAVILVENPDILATIAQRADDRPRLVIGFAAETGDLEAKAAAKRARKGCDWILANDVAGGDGVFGSDRNRVLVIDQDGADPWPPMAKDAVARRLVARIAGYFADPERARGDDR